MSIATIAFLSAVYAFCLKLGVMSIGSSVGWGARRERAVPPLSDILTRRGLRSRLLMAGIQYARSLGARNRRPRFIADQEEKPLANLVRGRPKLFRTLSFSR